MIAKELKSRDLQISQQLKEIEKYRQERKQNLCGFCQKKMDNVASSRTHQHHQVEEEDHRHASSRSVEVQTEDVIDSLERLKGAATVEQEAADEEDWYTNGNSDNENEKSPVNLYERGVNPVLERVNQVSILIF